MQRVHHRQVDVAVFLQKLLPLLEGHAALALPTAARQRRKEHPRPLAQHVSTALQRSGVSLPGAQHRLHVAHQLFQPHIAQADAEIARRHIFQLMGLVEDHRRRFRQHTRIRSCPSLLLDGQVGKEEMVVHDDHIAFEGAPAHLGDEAALIIGTALPQAGLAARVELWTIPGSTSGRASISTRSPVWVVFSQAAICWNWSISSRPFRIGWSRRAYSLLRQR